MVLLIDNYDSFTYNLYQAVASLGVECRVIRNDAMSVSRIRSLRPRQIILSPGPGRPEDAGVTAAVISALGRRVPILGVCLGHQAIGMAFGGKVVRAKKLMHGKTCRIRHDRRGLYRGLAQNLTVMRYHSLMVESHTLPECLEASSRSLDGTLMGVRHKSYPIEGVQFHPESVMTPEGQGMIKNFILCKKS